MISKLIPILIPAVILLTIPVMANPPDYPEYKSTLTRQVYFELGFDKETVEIVIPGEQETIRWRCDRSDLKVTDRKVKADGRVIFDSETITIDNVILPYDEITDIYIREEKGQSIISFSTRSTDDRRLSRIRRGNIIAPVDKIVIDEDEFVRGLVFSVTGDIEVYGEVNKDIVSLFGDIYVGPDAVIRGDVASVSGRVDVARDASIYGEIFSGEEGRTAQRHRFYRRYNEINIGGGAHYNRVDGLSIIPKVGYDDPDSLLPSVWVKGGYAFESERWRYEIGLEQTILRSMPLSVGGSAFRQLASEDNWLLRPAENNAFAVLFTEDFMDYYEAEGFEAHLRTRPLRDLTFEGGYRWEETKWLDAERDLWSLIGGDKKFPANFSSVSSPYREIGITEIDTSTNGFLYAKLEFDTRDKDDPFDYSAWAVTGSVEWAHPDLESDFDYRRYTVNARRYQKLNRRLMLLVRCIYGGSDGYLPMHKRFYIGGLGTLHGYKHKELMGTRFWMSNVEYRVDFPGSDLAASLSWDAGQISNTERFDAAAEVKHALGISVYVGNDFKVTAAKRLDGERDDDPRFYVRFAHVF